MSSSGRGSGRSSALLTLPLLFACAAKAGPTLQGPEAPRERAAALAAGHRELLQAHVLEAPSLPPVDTSNTWSDDAHAARLGQRLFFDPSLSGELLDGDNDGSLNTLGRKGEAGKVSCAGCHLPGSGFSDTRSIRQQISLGAGWGVRRTPSLLDVAQSKLLMWDGRRDALYNQIFVPIESAVEMNSSRLFVALRVFAQYRVEYEAIFGAMPALGNAALYPRLDAHTTGCRKLTRDLQCNTAMRGVPGDGAEFDALRADERSKVTRVVVNAGKALAAYERRLTCGPSRFDRWAQGDSGALTPQEQHGASLFVGKARCASCHSGPFFSDERFHNVGLKPELVATVFLNVGDRGAAQGLRDLSRDPLNVKGAFSDGNDGRVPEQLGAELEGAFRTPRLRCASQRPSFMHTGQLRTLADVVSFFDRGGDRYGYPGSSELTPLGLDAEERAALVAFLAALNGPGPPPELLEPIRD